MSALAESALISSRLAFARTAINRSRFVLILMRGALDGLAAVPPYADPDYVSLRREVALGGPGKASGALPLNGFFGLHPALRSLHQCYLARELTVFHALASPYRERSHFDGQDVLENGTPQPHALQSGWLNRALAQLPGSAGREAGVIPGQSVPLVMRGPAAVTSWLPSNLAALDEPTLQRITDLYPQNVVLAGRLADALAAGAMASEARDRSGERASEKSTAVVSGNAHPVPANTARYTEVVRAATAFLRQPEGPNIAVFDTSGWDTHANAGGAQGQLAARLAALDAGLGTLKRELGGVWGDTAVLLVTEFGRTAALNGTRGTDHGTATAAFLVGGAVAGGRVISDWPGLSARSLYKGRDLAPTLDLRAVLKGILVEHLGVSPRALEQTIFPGSSSVQPLRDLLRA
jgi:uncharacterized protein (DUF1501 family)